MSLPSQINSVEELKESILTIRKSNFIAQVYYVHSEVEAKEFLSEAKKKYFNASHHCYAYKLADGNNHYSDAGEPSGTAGIRILNAIEHFKLSNQMVIVSRFFGGIKLGVGLLGKTYYLAAHQVLNESKLITKNLFQKVTISAKIEKINIVHRILSKYQSKILKTDYQDHTMLTCLVKSKEIDMIFEKLIEIGKNEINFISGQEFLYK